MSATNMSTENHKLISESSENGRILHYSTILLVRYPFRYGWNFLMAVIIDLNFKIKTLQQRFFGKQAKSFGCMSSFLTKTVTSQDKMPYDHLLVKTSFFFTSCSWFYVYEL